MCDVTCVFVFVCVAFACMVLYCGVLCVWVSTVSYHVCHVVFAAVLFIPGVDAARARTHIIHACTCTMHHAPCTMHHARTTTTTGVPPACHRRATHTPTQDAVQSCNAMQQSNNAPPPSVYACVWGGCPVSVSCVWCGMVPPQLHPTHPRSRHLTLPYVFVLICRGPSERAS